MNKRIMKIISMLVIAITIFSIGTVCVANSATTGGVGDKWTLTTYNGEAKTTANKVLGFVQWVGYAISIGMLIYVGIKYVMASADEKANLKNSMIRYVIGAILIAGATTIAGWIFTFGQGV